jgi:hypothetical protein
MTIEEMKFTAAQLKKAADERRPLTVSELYSLVLRIEDWAATLADSEVFAPSNVVAFKPRVISNGHDSKPCDV